MTSRLRATLSQLLRRRSAVDPSGYWSRQHLYATLEWLSQARAATSDGGLAAHFHLLRWRWAPSYPETTGYTIPTLVRAARLLGRQELRDAAISLGEYLLRVRTAEGGVGHWLTGSAGPTLVFDTGQALFGWLAAWRETQSPEFKAAIKRAADWLVATQSADGSWRQGQHLGVVKVIDTRVSWALLEVDREFSDQSYVATARKNLDWALAHQEPDGWFRCASFRESSAPYTHNLCYVAEGFLEGGIHLGDERYIQTAKLTADALLERLSPEGALPSKFGPGWTPRARSSCLTGNCQAALIWLRLYGLTRDERYLAAARRAAQYVATTQEMRPCAPGIYGAVAGSWPIFAEYERLKYPNWAAKFFLDALLALDSYSSFVSIRG